MSIFSQTAIAFAAYVKSSRLNTTDGDIDCVVGIPRLLVVSIYI